ncbi:hypothetical protein FMM05_02535 [Flavobacterium zepuense]|uniref:Uncharacterized protein n=1 Tax=Flavobacterium zepuense TaxID=2593302 RepID=A0A552VAN2_9FLAO|nr:hypothetical protein [Flavobacterium zepuense]TRW27536.1 hypothetical protein FMM05_02535 [Flavobacterium zepuense]
MLSFLSKIIKFNNLLVLGISRTDNGNIYNVLKISKRKNKVDIISAATYTNKEELINSADLKLPVLLVIDGKGILNKKIDRKSEQDIAWRKNIDYDNIYYTEYNIAGYDFMTFCRKKAIDDIIQSLQQKGLLIVDFYIGPLLAALLQPVLNTNIIISNDVALSFDKGLLTSVEKYTVNAVNYTFGDKILSSDFIPLYGAAIQFYVAHPEFLKNSSDKINQENIIYQRSFNYLGLAILATFFTMLLFSYFLIMYYSSKNAELNQQNVYSSQTYKHIIELEKQKELKLKILNETGQLSKNFLSFYVYQLSKSAPSSIQFSELNLSPILGEIKENKKIVLESSILVIKGSTTNEYIFNEWLSGLKNVSWIKKFEIVSLKKDKKYIQQFEIKILLNDF